jgi:hypothetical protein
MNRNDSGAKMGVKGANVRAMAGCGDIPIKGMRDV